MAGTISQQELSAAQSLNQLHPLQEQKMFIDTFP